MIPMGMPVGMDIVSVTVLMDVVVVITRVDAERVLRNEKKSHDGDYQTQSKIFQTIKVHIGNRIRSHRTQQLAPMNHSYSEWTSLGTTVNEPHPIYACTDPRFEA